VESTQRLGEFVQRHIGPSAEECAAMARELGYASLDELIAAAVPPSIALGKALDLPAGRSEAETIADLRAIAGQNQVFRSFIGQGYYGTYTPSVILRNILENPAWYTAYTPYQPEISQGRLEALLNFQTMVADLTGLPIANASLLDEATAAAEAMTLLLRHAKPGARTFLVTADCHPQTLAVVRTRAECLDIAIRVAGAGDASLGEDVFGILVQYPGSSGELADHRALAAEAHARGVKVAVAADLLSLTLLTPPGEWGADVAVGTTQRFGVPFGFGGPHAAYLACRDELKRTMPGRLVGVSIDAHGRAAYRLALQTREQHIRREKATSNICTAQVLLAVMAGMYGVYHGPDGLTAIAARTHRRAVVLAEGLRRAGCDIPTRAFFDTISVRTGGATEAIHARAAAARINLRRIDAATVGISVDETTTEREIETLWTIFAPNFAGFAEFPESTGSDGSGAPGTRVLRYALVDASAPDTIPAALRRTGAFMTHPVFHKYRSETEMMRYLRALADKDLALDRTMIPLGSCTMKLNAATEMLAITWPEFAQIHPFAPAEQTRGYRQLIESLEAMLCKVTGYDAVSLQPNSGAQGEFAGLLAIRGYYRSRGEAERNVVLIPKSAHGTNPASAQMAGFDVVVVECDARGNVDLADLRRKAEQVRERLAALMVTYPSTHGVFEEKIVEICALIHECGGQVYVDGANLNALVGLAAPAEFGADVSHLNLHKTFCIPHGGGGPGVGPVAVRSHLAAFLPSSANVGPVSAAPFGSAGILPISWAYITLMGGRGLTEATKVAILSANYIAKRLADHYPVLYSGRGGLVAHECILDLRPIKDRFGITVDDVAKRLMDYGFHAPTMSFPVAGTLMIEPTESESKAELDRFCEAMIAIRNEVREIEDGTAHPLDNALRNAPHTADALLADTWTHPYSRAKAAYPVQALRERKYWPPVGRIDNAYGDRNLVCSCPPLEEYAVLV
jgi:glycine dehydrogenase